MAELHFQGSFNGGKYNINVGLSLFLWQEDGIHFVYSPSLDLTGYGKSEKEAKDSFQTTLSEFLSYTKNKNTIYDELEHQGWSVNRKKRRIHAPDFEEMLEDNEALKEILNKGGVQKATTNIELSLA